MDFMKILKSLEELVYEVMVMLVSSQGHCG